MDKQFWVDYFTKELNKELGKVEQKQQFKECGEQLFASYRCFVDAGFSEEQAFALLLNILAQNKPNAV